MSSRQQQPKHYRRTAVGLSPGRTAAIRNLIEAHVARTGTEPSDAELAATCAISVIGWGFQNKLLNCLTARLGGGAL